jgi:hypothetical protein
MWQWHAHSPERSSGTPGERGAALARGTGYLTTPAMWIDRALVEADAELHGETATDTKRLVVVLEQVRATMRALATATAAAKATTPDPILIPEPVAKGLARLRGPSSNPGACRQRRTCACSARASFPERRRLAAGPALGEHFAEHWREAVEPVLDHRPVGQEGEVPRLS